MVDSATIVPNSLVTVHVLGRQQNEEKNEIEISHCDRKWYYWAHGEESVVQVTEKAGGHVLLCIKFILAKTHV